MMKTSLLKNSLVAAFALLCVGAGAQNSSALKSANLKTHSRVQPAKVVKNKLVTPFMNTRQMIQKAKPTTSYFLPDICPSFYDWVMGTGDGKANWTSINGVINRAAALADSDAEFFDSDMLLAPKDSMLTYFNGTTGATSFKWSIPGGDPATVQSQDADVVYTAAGRYAFPTVIGANADGDSTYQAFGKIEIDKRAEISHTSSIAPLVNGAALTYGMKDAEGHLTGSNTVGFEKYGSMFTVGKAKSTLEAVNLYIVKNPKGANANSKVDVVVYAIGMDAQDKIVLDAIELGRKSVKISDMMADAKNVTGFQSQAGGAFLGMAEFKFDTPIQLEESVFFVTVENFGNDVAGGDDFAIMFDLTGEAPSEENFYQYNSFMFTELEYTDGSKAKDWYPLAWAFNFGDEYKNMDLFICPVLNYSSTPHGVESSSASALNSAYVADGAIVLKANGAKSADIYNVMGQLVYTTAIAAEGVYNAPSDNLSNGIYVVKFVNANGSVETVKVRK